MKQFSGVPEKRPKRRMARSVVTPGRAAMLTPIHRAGGQLEM
jgi:hypothetical protein